MVSVSISDMGALPHLLDRVQRGESIIITRDGKPVARLVPLDLDTRPRASVQEVVEGFRALRATVRPARPGEPTIREMIDEGRRF
jgi:prevent-host-death family protein